MLLAVFVAVNVVAFVNIVIRPDGIVCPVIALPAPSSQATVFSTSETIWASVASSSEIVSVPIVLSIPMPAVVAAISLRSSASLSFAPTEITG